MALVLGLPKGEQVAVSDNGYFEVIEIRSETEFVVKVHTYGKKFPCVNKIITDKKATEIFPNVMISCGLKGKMEVARVAIEAPRSIKILRESMKEKKYV
jgi:sRNA-binding carbon storage regulator CsrA